MNCAPKIIKRVVLKSEGYDIFASKYRKKGGRERGDLYDMI